jgi:multiple sugar transport system substrate-binding protein
MFFKKRNLVILIIMTIAGVVLWSGGQQDVSEKGQVELFFWSHLGGTAGEVLTEICEKYSTITPGVKVTYELTPRTDWDNKITTALATGIGPDIFTLSPGNFLRYVNASAVIDLTPYFTPQMEADFSSTLYNPLESFRSQGKLYAIPFEGGGIALFYSRDMFANAGLKPPEYWSELLRACDKLTTEQIFGIALNAQKGSNQNYQWYPFMWQGGGEILDEANRKSLFNSKATADALDLWGTIMKNGYTAAQFPAHPADQVLIGEGLVAMQIVGNWGVNDLDEDGKFAAAHVDFVHLPKPEGGKYINDLGGNALVGSSNSKNKKETAEFVVWATAEEVDLLVKYCSYGKYSASPRVSVMNGLTGIYTKGLKKKFQDIINPAGRYEPSLPPEIVDIIGDAIQNCMFKNGRGPNEAKKASERIDEFLKTYSGAM